jgi:cysteine desulfurase/selenocysteine lyase
MDISKIRQDFPCLEKITSKKPIIYFDNTAVTLTPNSVIDSMVNYYSSPGNLRSAHEFSINTMTKCDDARKKIKDFINARSSNEIVWTKNATEGINLISRTLDFQPGDIVLTSDKEHISNVIPWHNIKHNGIVHEVVPSNEDNTFNIGQFEKMLSDNVRLVSMNLTSIIDGYTIPAKEIIRISHEHGALVLLDGVLAVPHQTINVQDLDTDFLVFSCSNMCGPNGIGILYGKEELLFDLKPFLGGGGANTDITYTDSEYQKPPAKFEAGNLNCANIIGAGSAVDYLNSIGLDNIKKHEYTLNKLLTEEFAGIDNLAIIGPDDPKLRGGMFNFNLKGINPHDVAISLEELGNILVRSGILCSQPWIYDHMKAGAVSILFYLYNSIEEVEFLAETLKKLIKDFS